MKSLSFVLMALMCLSGSASFATEFLAQARLFAGSTSANPENLNQELSAQGIQDFKSIYKLGVEITYPVTKFLEVGVNYSKRNFSKDETDSNLTTDYLATLNQDMLLLVARVPLLKTDLLRIDAFGGVGGSNTTFTLKTATQDGELTRREGNDWFASVASAYGASLAIGYKKIYVVFEGGYESNKVDSFKRSGNINNNIQTLDLSGGYFTLGLMFDGVTAHTK